MIRIMTDLHLTEAAISILKSRGNHESRVTDHYFAVLFSKYHVSRVMFEANFD